MKRENDTPATKETWLQRQDTELEWFHPAYRAIWLNPAIRQRNGTALFSRQPALFPRPVNAVYPAHTKDELLERRQRRLEKKYHPDDPDEYYYPEFLEFHGGKVKLKNRLTRFKPSSLRNQILKPYNKARSEYPTLSNWRDARRFRQHFLFKYFHRSMFLLFDFDAHSQDDLDLLPARLQKFKEVSSEWTLLCNRSPGRLINDQRVTGIHAWVILDQPYSVQFLENEIVCSLKREFSEFSEIYCGLNKPMRIPGQKYLEPVSLDTEGNIHDLPLNGSSSACYDALCEQLEEITRAGTLTSLDQIKKLFSIRSLKQPGKEKSEAGVCANKYVTASTSTSTKTGDTYKLICYESGRLVRMHDGDKAKQIEIIDQVKQAVRHRTSGGTAGDELELNRKVTSVVKKHFDEYEPTLSSGTSRSLDVDPVDLDTHLARIGISTVSRAFVQRWLPVAKAYKGFVATRPRTRRTGKTMWELAGSQRRYNKIRNELIDRGVWFVAKEKSAETHKCQQVVLSPSIADAASIHSAQGPGADNVECCWLCEQPTTATAEFYEVEDRLGRNVDALLCSSCHGTVIHASLAESAQIIELIAIDAPVVSTWESEADVSWDGHQNRHETIWEAPAIEE